MEVYFFFLQHIRCSNVFNINNLVITVSRDNAYLFSIKNIFLQYTSTLNIQSSKIFTMKINFGMGYFKIIYTASFSCEKNDVYCYILSKKNLPAVQIWAQSLNWENLEKGMATHPYILAWRSHGQRSLVGYSPWVRKEWETTELPTLSLSSYPLLS